MVIPTNTQSNQAEYATEEQPSVKLNTCWAVSKAFPESGSAQCFATSDEAIRFLDEDEGKL